MNYKPYGQKSITIDGVKIYLKDKEWDNLHHLYFNHATVASSKSLHDRADELDFNSGPLDWWIIGGTITNTTSQSICSLGYSNTVDVAGTIFYNIYQTPSGRSEFYIDYRNTADKRHINSTPTLTTTAQVEAWVVITEGT